MFPFTRTVLIFFIAGLLFIVPRARRTLGAYRIPRETGLLIPSGKRHKSYKRTSPVRCAGLRTVVRIVVFAQVDFVGVGGLYIQTIIAAWSHRQNLFPNTSAITNHSRMPKSIS